MSAAKWKMIAGAAAGLLGLAGGTIAAYGSLPSAPDPTPPAPVPAPVAPPPKNEPAPMAKTNAELVRDAKDRFAELEQLLTLITEAELLKHRREISAAGQPGKEDRAALTKKVAELERQIESLKPRLKYYSDAFGLSSPSRLPWGIKKIKEELEKREKPEDPKSSDPKPAPDADLKLLNGDWKVVALVTNGKKAPAAELKGMRWSFTGAEVHFADPGEGPGGKSSVKLDASQSPKHIDLVGLDEPVKGKTILGIYKLGTDQLVICCRDWNSAGMGRPTAFAAGELSALSVITLERITDKK